MADLFDRETLDRFRKMKPREVYEEAKNAVYRQGAVTSEEFREVFEALVEEGILTWSQIEQYER